MRKATPGRADFPDYKRIFAFEWYRFFSRLLLFFHPLVNRDKVLSRLDKYLRERSLKSFFARLPLALERQAVPLLSVVITCYNNGIYLQEAVDSVWGQTFRNFEVILVDDGSTREETLAAVREFEKEPGLKVIRQENKGSAAARNAGIKIARGEYICCLDADDRLGPEYFKKCLQVLENFPEFGLAYGWVRVFGVDNYLWQTRDLKREKFNHDFPVNQGAVYRKKAWQEVGGYKAEMKYYDDWEFFLSLLEKGYRGKSIPRVLYHFRTHCKSKVKSVDPKVRAGYFIKLKRLHPEFFEPESESREEIKASGLKEEETGTAVSA